MKEYELTNNAVSLRQYSKTLALFALVTGASAFAPSQVARTSTSLNFIYGDYDDKEWSLAAKEVVYAAWDPKAARSTKNFNPFETFEGNSPDASGIFPGESRYKDPVRPDVSYAIMLVEKARLEEIAAAPKYVVGDPGLKATK